jgi:hypothetical protein
MLTVDDVTRAVSDIAEIFWDDERAHADEDALHKSVLQAIADGNCEDPKACAAEALKTTDISFARRCA